jgi:hypothetical protein
MPGALPTAKRPLLVSRGFESSRLQQRLLALVYERLLPIIQLPATAPRGSQSSDCLPRDHGCGASLQEEADGEDR